MASQPKPVVQASPEEVAHESYPELIGQPAEPVESSEDVNAYTEASAAVEPESITETADVVEEQPE